MTAPGLLVAASFVPAGCRAGGDERRLPQDAPEADTVPAQSEPERAHPRFAITRDEVLALVDATGPAVRDAVAEDPAGFLELVGAVLALPAELTVLVDKEHPLAADHVPADLVELDSLADRLALSRPGHRLTAPAAEALVEMSEAASRDGITLVASSAYRSYAYQADLYARWVDELGREEADRVSARPGTSQHQLGTTLDFGCICDEFAAQPAGRWLADNAHRFGFSLSYPQGYEQITGYSYEPWHFRYVGSQSAALEREFFAGIQQWMLEFLNENRAVLEHAADESTSES